MSRINLLIRTSIIFYIYIHILHLWQGALSLPLALILFVTSITLGSLIGYRLPRQISKKDILILVSFPLLLEGIRFLLLLIDLLFVRYFSTLVIYWDVTQQPLRVILYAIFYSSIIFMRSKSYRIIEVAVRPFLILIIFWHMRNFRLGIYPTLLSLLMSLIIYNMLEIALLARLLNSHLNRKNMLWIALKVVAFSAFSSIIALPWVYSKASPHIKHRETLMRSKWNNFDISETLSLEPEVTMGSKLLFLVQSNGALPENLLLKRMTLSRYTSTDGFSKVDKLDDLYSSAIAPYQIWSTPSGVDQNSTLSMNFYLVNLPKNAIITPYNISTYQKINYKNNTQFTHTYTINYFNPLGYREDIEQKSAYISPDLYMHDVYYDQTGVTREIESLTHKITHGIVSDYEKALAIESYFHNNFYYTLTPGQSENSDQLHYFLFQSQRGYCSYFATAMTLMARSLGMPARVAGGFRLTRDNQLLDFYAVTSAQAHAWVEIYFEDIGWVSFDPTSSRLSAQEFILEEESAINNDIYDFIQKIYDFDEQIVSQSPFYHQQENPASKTSLQLKSLIITISISLILFILILLLLRISILKKSLRSSENQLHLALQLWQILLEYPQKQDWIVILYDSEEEKKSVHKFLFYDKQYFTQEDSQLVRSHLMRCYKYYRNHHSLIQQILHLRSISIWRFKSVLLQ